MEELFQYDVSSTSYLCVEDLTMIKPQKSAPVQDLWVRAGVGDTTRYIPVHILAPRIGQELCYLLPLVHTLTGCDHTSKVGIKYAALNVNQSEYLRNFDSGQSCTDDFVASCEAYLVQVLKRNTTCTTIDQLRNYIYHHSKGVSLDQLPPTSHVIERHIRRAYVLCNLSDGDIITPS